MTLSTLRKLLAFDAMTCGLVFAACVPAAGTATALTGLPAAVVVAGGWICLAAGLLFAALAASRTPYRPLLMLAVAGNALWVAASLAVVIVLGAPLTGAGVAIVVAQAGAVAVLTWLEAMGLAVVPKQTLAA